MWSTVIFDTQTGTRLEEVQPTSTGWQRGSVTEQSHSFFLPDLGMTREQLWELFGYESPNDRAIAECWNGMPVYQGIITDHDYDEASGILKVTHKDIRFIASDRWLHGIGAYAPALRYQWSGLSWRGMAARTAGYIFTAPISAAWPLPVTIPAEEAGAEELDIWAWQFRSGESLLKEIEEMPGGPDIDFQPRIRDGKFGWDLRLGTPYLTGPTLEAHVQAELSPLDKVSQKRSAAEKYTGVFGIGEGSEQDMIVGGAAEPESAGLARDTKLTVKSSSLAEVNRRSRAYLDGRKKPTERWAADLVTDAVNPGGVDPAALRIGSILETQSAGSLWLPDAPRQHRVLSFSGSVSDPHTINLALETI